ncbi:hypothetical protein GW17_00061418 [Ensete ventricosum]|nr:hypothetical protein GW17_00061418 [Ensete ventricosum]
MYAHKPKDTDKHEHSIKHLVYILTVTQCAGIPSRRGQLGFSSCVGVLFPTMWGTL